MVVSLRQTKPRRLAKVVPSEMRWVIASTCGAVASHERSFSVLPDPFGVLTKISRGRGTAASFRSWNKRRHSVVMPAACWRSWR